MRSLAQMHLARMQARTAATGESRADLSYYELMRAKLATDQRRLKSIQSIKRKIQVKRELLPDYVAYVEGVLAGNAGAPDDVLITVMVWRLDVGDYLAGLAIARYALAHGLTLPERYERTLATFMTEQIAEAVLAGGEVALTVLDELTTLIEDQDMPDPVRAKWHKAYGLLLRETEPTQALTHYRQALALAPHCGVKKEIAHLERLLSPQPSGAEREKAQ